MAEENIYKVVLDSLSAHVAILDETGVIVETNRTWQEFGQKNQICGPADCVGINYLHVCDQAKKNLTECADTIAQGIRKVMSGELEEFLTQYPCHSGNTQKWYALRVVRYRSKTVKRFIVTHEDITPIMLTQQKLQKKEQELSEQSTKLQESNVALKVLLQHRDEGRLRFEQTIIDNIHRLVMPYVEKLMAGRLTERDRNLAEIVKNHLLEVVSPFLNRLTNVNRLLTPQEIQVASLVRDGKTSKDIAEVLGVSVSAVDFHRKSIRRKLGLRMTGKNLRAHLLSLR